VVLNERNRRRFSRLGFGGDFCMLGMRACEIDPLAQMFILALRLECCLDILGIPELSKVLRSCRE